MIVSIGLSLALRYIFQFVIGGSTYQLPGASPAPIQLGPISLSYIDLISMAISIVVILGVAYFLAPHPDRQGDARDLGQPAARRRHPASTSTASSGSSGSSPARWPRSSGILWAYFRPGVAWDMGTQMLLLIFAAITLGGLGTAFGALLGSLIVGIVVEVSTLLDSVRPQVRGRPRRADPHPADQTSGSARSQREIGLGRHGLGSHPQQHRSAISSAR